MQTASSLPARILISDDDPRVTASMQALLGDYEVATVHDGADALARLAQQPYDLLLLDLNMPRLHGQQVIEAVRERGHDTAIVVVSGEQGVECAVNAMRCGAQDFLRKPYAPEELLSRIHITLREQQLVRENRRIQNRLQASEKLHRFFVENSPDLIFLLDENGCFVFLNEGAETLLGYRRREQIGRAFQDWVHPDDLGPAQYALCTTAVGARTAHPLELRLRHRNPEQEARLFEARIWRVDLDSLDVGRSGSGIYGVARDVSDRKKSEGIISFQASHDLLTRLPNRFLFKDRVTLAIKQAQRDQQGFAVLYLDLDRFKLVNDSLGHMIGDELLQAVATRVRASLRDVDTLARLGGDEFVLLLPRVSLPADAETVARKLLREIEQPFTVSGHDLYVGASIGIALHPADGSNADTLIKHADLAMYAVKDHGRNGFQFYRPEIDNGSARKLVLANGLHRALVEGELAVYYQPQVDSQTRRITGVEALVRWHHPSLGLLSPSEFLPIAEETGLMVAIGEWVLQQACADMRRWRVRGMLDIRLAVNFGAVQVDQANFVELVLGTLRNSGLPPSVLEVEVTEDGIMKDMQAAAHKLSLLAQAGVRIAIDDFGTGYSSLSYLRSLPIHTIKIDRSFMQDVRGAGGDHSLITAIVNIAGSLSLNSIAEGVETEAQLEFLCSHGCPEAQGFLFSRAVPASDIDGLLQAQSPARAA